MFRILAILSVASLGWAQSCAVCCLGTGKCNNLATNLGSCCTRGETCCQLGTASFPGAYTCCAAGSSCKSTGTVFAPINKCTAPASPIMPVAAPIEIRQTVATTVTAAAACPVCCLGAGQCVGLTSATAVGSCCPTGTSCCLSRGSTSTAGAYTCCASSTSICSTEVQYSNSISTVAPGYCVARSQLLCRGHTVVTKSAASNVELRCGLGQKACPNANDFCDTTNYLTADPLVGVCCRDMDSHSGCQQQTTCSRCTAANCYWNEETGYCNSRCTGSVLFGSTIAPSCHTTADQCGSGPTDSCARHCGEVTPNRFNKPPPASLVSQGLDTPQVAGQDMAGREPAVSNSYPGAASILGKPKVGVAGCQYASRSTVLDNYSCVNENGITLNSPTITSLETCEDAVLESARCGPFFASNGGTFCHCLPEGEACQKTSNPGTKVYSLTCGGNKQPADYPYSAITQPWLNYVNSDNGPYNDRPYDLTADGGGITNGRVGRRLTQWNPFWWDPFQPSVRAPRGPMLFGPPVYRPLPKAGAPAPDPAWVVVSTSYLEETLQYEASGGRSRTCSCDPLCIQYGDCCKDYVAICLDVSGGAGTGR